MPGVIASGAIARLQATGVSRTIWQCFIIRDIIEDHASPTDDGLQPMFVERVKLSGPATFFFSIFYLQYAINLYIVDAQERLA